VTNYLAKIMDHIPPEKRKGLGKRRRNCGSAKEITDEVLVTSEYDLNPEH
jgi:hypothetical protein